jgi:hypothetical protein
MAVSPSNSLVFPTSLKVLTMPYAVEIGVLSLLPTTLKSLALDWVVQGPAQGPDLLLSGVARLPQLDTLHLRTKIDLVWPAAGHAYSGLTASSSLHTLVLIGRLPDGICHTCFP